MKPYFDTEDKIQSLRTALKEREKTPFRIGMGEKGKGYDCFHFVIDVYQATGIDMGGMKKFEGRVALNWSKLNKRSLILDFLHEDPVARKHLHRLEPEEPILPGDLIAVRQGMSCNHLAIAEDQETAWHIPRGGRVGEIAIQELRRAKTIHAIYRITQ